MALKWDGKRVLNNINMTMRQRLDSAAIAWVNYTQQKLNEKTNRDGKTPSKGKTYPAMVTSHLRRSIDWERGSGLSVRVGTNVEYGKHLQFKPVKRGGRPWMTLANRETRQAIQRILGRPFRSSIQ